MNKLLLPILAVSLMVPAVAQAADPCRNAKGQFAKCGTPGAMTYAQYKATKGSKPAAVKSTPTPAASAKPSLFSFKPKASPTPASSASAKPSLFSFKPKAKPTATPTAGPTPKPTAAAKPGLMAKLKGMGKPKPTATPAAKH